MADYSDDFYSDDEDKDTKASARGTSSLMPKIVEVPSETSSQPDTNRSDYNQNGTDENSNEDTEDEDEYPQKPHTSSASKRGKRKAKVRNGKSVVDMTPPEKHLERAEKLIKRYIKHKKVDSAMQELVRCTALTRIVYGDNHWKVAQSHANLAQSYFDLKGYAPQAQQHAEQARDIMMSGVQMSSDSTDKANIMGVLVTIYYTLGRALTVLKKYSEAEQSLLKAEKIAAERGKLSSVKESEIEEWDIKISLAIGRLSGKAQKWAVAATYFEKALELLQSKYGPDAVELIPVYQGLGKIEQGKGKHADHEKAIEYFLQAHSIASSKYKDNSLEVADTARALASAYENVGDEDAETSAESYLNECLSTYQVEYGPHHEKTVEVQDELARLMMRTDRHEEAIDLLRSALEAKKEVHGEYSQPVAETWKLIGSAQLSRGDADKAIRALKKCHTIECSLYGTNNKKSKDTQRTIDILMSNPNISEKMKKSKAQELKERPRFNGVVSRGSALGGCKPGASY